MTDNPGSPDPEQAAKLLRLTSGIDVTSADGRAGLMALLREIEREAPGAIERLAADIQLRRAAERYPEAFARAQ